MLAKVVLESKYFETFDREMLFFRQRVVHVGDAGVSRARRQRTVYKETKMRVRTKANPFIAAVAEIQIDH